jgi:glutamyl-tRNA synthetase
MDSKEATTKMYANYKKVLKNAKDGEVVTRFPPEPSGFLHVGHVKAAMLNYHYAKIYGGKMILRFDDTNPMAEKEEFVENIKRDLKTLDIKPDQVTHTSDHFDKLIEFMKKMITDGNAYADCSTGDEMHD